MLHLRRGTSQRTGPAHPHPPRQHARRPRQPPHPAFRPTAATAATHARGQRAHRAAAQPNRPGGEGLHRAQPAPRRRQPAARGPRAAGNWLQPHPRHHRPGRVQRHTSPGERQLHLRAALSDPHRRGMQRSVKQRRMQTEDPSAAAPSGRATSAKTSPPRRHTARSPWNARPVTKARRRQPLIEPLQRHPTAPSGGQATKPARSRSAAGPRIPLAWRIHPPPGRVLPPCVHTHRPAAGLVRRARPSPAP